MECSAHQTPPTHSPRPTMRVRGYLKITHITSMTHHADLPVVAAHLAGPQVHIQLHLGARRAAYEVGVGISSRVNAWRVWCDVDIATSFRGSSKQGRGMKGCRSCLRTCSKDSKAWCMGPSAKRWITHTRTVRHCHRLGPQYSASARTCP